MKIEIDVSPQAVASIQKWAHCLPMFLNNSDHAPFDLWHNGGPGGAVGNFYNLSDALLVEEIFNKVLVQVLNN